MVISSADGIEIEESSIRVMTGDLDGNCVKAKEGHLIVIRLVLLAERISGD
jgi:hypothetical protein